MKDPFDEKQLKNSQVELIDINLLKLSENNPREIQTKKFAKLKRSLTEFPEMMYKRPVMYADDYQVKGGNMRVRAGRQLGWERIPAMSVSGWTEDQIREFVIKDNVQFGDWDTDILSSYYDLEELDQWGLDDAKLAEYFKTDEYDEIMDAGVDPDYPILPQASEKHDYVMIVCDNEIDHAYLQTLFKLKTMKSYKNEVVGLGRVITVSHFRECIDDKIKRVHERADTAGDPEPQEGGQG